MTKIGKYLTVQKVDVPERVTDVWQVFGTTDVLGRVEWSGRWRQYVFTPMKGTIYNAGCLDDISAFLKAQNINHRNSLVK